MVAITKPKAPKPSQSGDRSRSKPLSRRPIEKKNNKKGGRGSGKNPNLIPLGKNKILDERKKKKEEEETEEDGDKREESSSDATLLISTTPAAQQLRFFLDLFQTANKVKLSPLELDAFKDTCMVELADGVEQNVDNLCDHMKSAFGSSWREALSEGQLAEGEIDVGTPALLIISTSALRSLELLRGLKSLTRECRPAKLFAKHMKVEDQVTSLKTRVNIASGTPSRIKKLIDVDALSLSRVGMVLLDMHRDVKGYSLFTLPQVSTEFWDLYKTHLQPRLSQGDMRICLYGAIPINEKRGKKAIKSDE
ncbi:protein CMSS1 [Canna indica]|uniref:Protein CMSS1 n=1 Tax=Canna indica TaxID=4628 RepID=A0AAQ3KQ73_9LILI|nr:protein CMSS1 [Canna indica]